MVILPVIARERAEPMLTPKVERLPPVTVEFLRIVRGVEAVRLRCEGCKAVQVTTWGDLGLPNDAPFPPSGAAWKCGMCGGTKIVATPELPVDLKDQGELPIVTTTSPEAQGVETDDRGAISPALRERLEAMVARLGKPEV